MDAAKKKSLEAAGWKVGDSAQFLEMSEDERQLLDVRVQLALAVRNQRRLQRMSQKELGARLKTSQPRVAKIEWAARDISMDQLIRAFAAARGKIRVKPSSAGIRIVFESVKPRRGARTAARSSKD